MKFSSPAPELTPNGRTGVLGRTGGAGEAEAGERLLLGSAWSGRPSVLGSSSGDVDGIFRPFEADSDAVLVFELLG